MVSSYYRLLPRPGSGTPRSGRREGFILANVVWAAHDTLDVYCALAQRVEEALLDKEELTGMLQDCSKCFDPLSHDIMLRLGSESVASQRHLAPLIRIHENLRRRFKFSGGVGEVFRPFNGILQD